MSWEENEKFGMTSFIFGILSVVFLNSYDLIFYLTPILGILGISFYFVQKKKSKSKFATIGLILSIIGLSLFIILILLNYIFYSTYSVGQ